MNTCSNDLFVSGCSKWIFFLIWVNVKKIIYGALELNELNNEKELWQLRHRNQVFAEFSELCQIEENIFII